MDPSSGLALFTDGSCWHMDRVGGWGWIAFDAFDGEQTASGARVDTTVNQMELTAIAEGLETLRREYGPCPVLVYSDSAYSVNGATHRHYARNVNKDEWARVDMAADSHLEVWFIHVKGHHESYYNDIADRLAGEARREFQSSANHPTT